MDEKKIEAEELLLDLLANAPSSFAALYGFVVRSLGSRPSVKEMIDILTALETSGCVRVAQMTSDAASLGIMDHGALLAELWVRVLNLAEIAAFREGFKTWAPSARSDGGGHVPSVPALGATGASPSTANA